MTIAPCDHTSVGIIVFRVGELLIIDRKRPPFGLAAPAGHVDKHGNIDDPEEAQFERAAIEELEEETGLVATSLTLIGEGRKDNPCRRSGGSWHYWRIYRAETTGDLRPSTEETRGCFWCSYEQMRLLLDGKTIQMSYGEASLEPVWREWFLRLNMLDKFILSQY